MLIQHYGPRAGLVESRPVLLSTLRRRRLRFAYWIVLIAIWGLVVAPAVTQAMGLAHLRGALDPWSEICSASDDGSSSDHVVVGHLGHCAMCGQQAGNAPALPVVATALVLPADRAAFLPPLFGHAPRPLYAWSALRARAPPSFS
jgi:hypothetical protein